MGNRAQDDPNPARGEPVAGPVHHLTGACACALAVVVVFGRTAGFQFVFWDDDINILMNERIRGLTGENLRWMFTDFSYALRYQPLSWLGWSLDYLFWGLDPRGYHVSAIGLHAACAAMAYLALRKVAEQTLVAGALTRAQVVWLAAAAMFWAVHPLRAEVAAWVTGRRYSQTMFFLLAAWLLDPGGWRGGGAGRRDAARLAASVGAFAASLLTYPLAVEWPVALAMIDWARWRKSGAGGAEGFPWREWAVRRAPVFALGAGLALLTISGRYFAAGEWGEPLTLEAFPISARVKQAAYILMLYAGETVIPWNLSICYPRLDKMDPLQGIFALSLAGVAGITLLLGALAARWRWPLACWLGYCALMFTKLGWTESPHYANDRYVHVAAMALSAGMFGALNALDTAVSARALGRRILMACAGGMILIYSAAAFRQGGIWRNSETLLTTASARLGPHKYQSEILWRLGQVRENAGDKPGALEAFSGAVAATPEDSRARYYRARVLVALNRPGEAADDLARVLETKDDPNIRFQFGDLLLRLGRTEEALAELRAAAAADAKNAGARLRIGVILESRRQYAEGLAALEEAERIAPDDPQIREAAGRLRAKLGGR